MASRGCERGQILVHRVVAMHQSAEGDGVALPQPRLSEPFDRAGLDRGNEIRAEEFGDLAGYSRRHERCSGAGQFDDQAGRGHGVERRRRAVDRPILTCVRDEPPETASAGGGGCDAIETCRRRQTRRRESGWRVQVGRAANQWRPSPVSMTVRQRRPTGDLELDAGGDFDLHHLESVRVAIANGPRGSGCRLRSTVMARTSTGTLSSGAMRGGRRLLTNACARSSKILRSCSRRRFAQSARFAPPGRGDGRGSGSGCAPADTSNR